MKTILIPTEDHDAMQAVLEAARLFAHIFDSYMEGFAVHPSAATYVAVEPVSSLAISGAYENDAELASQAHALFEAFMTARGVPRAERENGGYSYGWPHQEAGDDAFIGSYGRTFDLIALGRPGRAAQDPRMPPLEAALFDSGRPVLIVPPNAPQSLGRNVLVAWNRSTEQARTNAFAMGLLRLAEQVTVLTVEGGTTPGPSGEEAALNLRRNGVKATALTVKPGTRSTGEAILDHAARLGCDLLVKGAYTQSRLRQLMFGGATRHILANANLPVLMAH
ncbi:MAG TPA: universal stress protein [Xanthobacteraceae bacterium]|jgi:nucleotide-binding universal stress UspA family protein